MLNSIPLKNSLLSSTAVLSKTFLDPCLRQSREYDRVSAYFSSALIALVPAAMQQFFESGGKIRLVCSPFMSADDAQAILDAVGENEPDASAIFSQSWSSVLEEQGDFQLPARLLRALVHSGHLELRIASVGKGIFHDKLGIFRDEVGNVVTFTGSANETFAAWSGRNHERIDICRSWVDGDQERLTEHQTQFDDLWQGKLEGVVLYSGEDISQVLRVEDQDEDWVELYKKIRSTEDKVSDSSVQLREYQESAIQSWFDNGNRGVISFVTGGGKTLTAISAMQQWFEQSGHRTGVVMVPTTILCGQWRKELRRFFSDLEIIEAHSESPNKNWKTLLKPFLDVSRFSDRRAIVVTTYATAGSAAFAAMLPSHEKMIAIGDEVHKFGSSKNREISNWFSPQARIGLSATPLRRFDDEGTDAIWDFWGKQLDPVYSLEEAISDGNLCSYNFSFEEYSLTSEEQDQWDIFTQEINILKARLEQCAPEEKNKLRDQLEKKQMDRARVLKKSEAKLPIVREILESNYSDGDRWLVYCEDIDHLNQVEKSVRDYSKSVVVMQYHSQNIAEHDLVMDYFINEGGILLAIRCLDEGVDIPNINKAIIVSSSTSEREFIQRRGRILRRYPGKIRAELWDFLTIGPGGCSLYQAERERLLKFAGPSETPNAKLKLESRKC